MRIVVLVMLVFMASSSFAQWEGANQGESHGQEPSFNQCTDLGREFSYLRSYGHTGLYNNGSGLVHGAHTDYQWMCWVGSQDPCNDGQVPNSPSHDGACVTPSSAEAEHQCASSSSSSGRAGWISETCFPAVTEENYNECSSVSGNACYATPEDIANQPNPEDYTCGTFNGSPLCVSSIGESSIGTSSEIVGSTSSEAPASTSSEVIQDSASGTTTTVTTESVTSTTSNTSSVSGGPGSVDNGATLDAGAGQSAPVMCENGQLASDLNQCDTLTVCPPGTYVDSSICIALPTQTTVTETTETTTTTTVVDNSTGQEETTVSQGTSEQTVSAGQGAEQSKLDLDVTFEFDGPCDPSQANYYECQETESQLPEHTTVENQSYEEGAQGFYDRVRAAPIVQGFDGLANIVPSGGGTCEPLTMDLSGTIMGQSVGTNVHCTIAQDIASIIAAIMTIAWLVMAAFLFGRA